MNNNEAPAALPNMNVLEIRVHSPEGTITFRPEQMLHWVPVSPLGPTLVTKDAEGRTHQWVGFGFQVVMEESRIARPA